MQWLQIFTEVVGHFFATQIGSRQFAHRRRSDATFGFGMSATRRQTTQTRSLIAPCIARPPANPATDYSSRSVMTICLTKQSSVCDISARVNVMIVTGTQCSAPPVVATETKAPPRWREGLREPGQSAAVGSISGQITMRLLNTLL